MAIQLSPPPIQEDPGSFAWLEWYNSLNKYITSVSSVSWSILDKTGSALSDIVSRPHNVLQSIQGHSDGYHISAAQYAALGKFTTKVGDPTTTDIPAGFIAAYKNSTTGVISWWANDGGTMVRIAQTALAG